MWLLKDGHDHTQGHLSLGRVTFPQTRTHVPCCHLHPWLSAPLSSPVLFEISWEEGVGAMGPQSCSPITPTVINSANQQCGPGEHPLLLPTISSHPKPHIKQGAKPWSIINP